MNLVLENAVVVGTELAVSFTDGTELYLPLDMLRRACPCAGCQGEPDALGRVLRPVVNLGPRAFDLTGLAVVGGYAVQPTWGDGHSTGLYSFTYLVELSALSKS